MSTAEQQQRLAGFQTASLAIVPLAAHDNNTALAQMKLAPADRENLRQQLTAAPAAAASTRNPAAAAAAKPEPTRLVEIVLWDSHAPDGDIVRVVSGGYAREVMLAKTPTSVYVPYDGSGAIGVVGVRDGGGGITLAIKGSATQVLMPVMSEGQALSLPVRLQ